MKPTDKQIERLISASEDMAAYLAMDACRIIVEWPDDANLVPYLETLPVKVAREFDLAIADIQETMMTGSPDMQTARQQREKYAAAMAEMRQK